MTCCNLLRCAVGVGGKDVSLEGRHRGSYIEIRNASSVHVFSSSRCSLHYFTVSDENAT